MTKIKEIKTKQVSEDIGYICDVCGKTVIFELRFLPQFNTITWSFPTGNIGTATETIYICSLECMLKTLKEIYFGTHIELSYDFLESIKNKKEKLMNGIDENGFPDNSKPSVLNKTEILKG